MKNELLELGNKLWEYHHMNHELRKCDCILVLGSHDPRVAERAANLYHEGFAETIIFSGGLGRLTKEIWSESEAELFAGIAIKSGVPPKAIIIENKSTNTGENIIFTRRLLEEKQLDLHSFLVVQKPYMERRSYATFMKFWPGKDLVVTSPQTTFYDYPNDQISMEEVINLMVGDLHRIMVYPEKGYQIYQEVPKDVEEAFTKLVQMGYTANLIKEKRV